MFRAFGNKENGILYRLLFQTSPIKIGLNEIYNGMMQLQYNELHHFQPPPKSRYTWTVALSWAFLVSINSSLFSKASRWVIKTSK